MNEMDKKAKDIIAREFMKFCNKGRGWKFIDADTGEEIEVGKEA